MRETPLWLYFTFYLFHGLKGDWVDPHSMDSNVKEKMRSFSQKTPHLNTEFCSHVINCDSDLYLRRIVRLLLNNAYLDQEDFMGYLNGHLNIKLRSEDYKFLIDFSQSDESKGEAYSEVSSIFENAFQKTSFDKLKEMVLSFEERLHLVIVNPTTYAIVSVCFTLYVTYKLLTANFTWRTIIKYLFFFLYVADFMITYLQIVRDEEINNMVTIKKSGTIPPECDPQKLSWWQYMKTQFESAIFENPCKEYYKATHQDFKYLVAPTRVLALQFKTVLVGPFGDIGEAIGKFGRGMFTSLPWGLNIAIFPIMLIAVLVMVFIAFLFFTRTHFKVSIFHLFTIEMGQPVRYERPLDAIQRPNRRTIREVGNEADHRALIEDTSNDSSSPQLNTNQESDIGANEEENICREQKTEDLLANSTLITTLDSNSEAVSDES